MSTELEDLKRMLGEKNATLAEYRKGVTALELKAMTAEIENMGIIDDRKASTFTDRDAFVRLNTVQEVLSIVAKHTRRIR